MPLQFVHGGGNAAAFQGASDTAGTFSQLQMQREAHELAQRAGEEQLKQAELSRRIQEQGLRQQRDMERAALRAGRMDMRGLYARGDDEARAQIGQVRSAAEGLDPAAAAALVQSAFPMVQGGMNQRSAEGEIERIQNLVSQGAYSTGVGDQDALYVDTLQQLVEGVRSGGIDPATARQQADGLLQSIAATQAKRQAIQDDLTWANSLTQQMPPGADTNRLRGIMEGRARGVYDNEEFRAQVISEVYRTDPIVTVSSGLEVRDRTGFTRGGGRPSSMMNPGQAAQFEALLEQEAREAASGWAKVTEPTGEEYDARVEMERERLRDRLLDELGWMTGGGFWDRAQSAVGGAMAEARAAAGLTSTGGREVTVDFGAITDPSRNPSLRAAPAEDPGLFGGPTEVDEAVQQMDSQRYGERVEGRALESILGNRPSLQPGPPK